MSVNKEHKEFHTLDLSAGWETPPGYPAGITQKILSGALDEKDMRGTRTRLLRFAPGTFTTAPFVHDYWEEVFQLSGDLIVGNDAQGKGGEAFPPSRENRPGNWSWSLNAVLRSMMPAICRPPPLVGPARTRDRPAETDVAGYERDDGGGGSARWRRYGRRSGTSAPGSTGCCAP